MLPFLWQTALDSNVGCALFVLLWYNKFFFGKWDELRVTRVVQLFLHLRLNYYETKIQMLSAFPWKPAQPRFLKIKLKSLFFLRAHNTRHFTRSKAEIVAENLTDPIKSWKGRRLIRKPYCTSFDYQRYKLKYNLMLATFHEYRICL